MDSDDRIERARTADRTRSTDHRSPRSAGRRRLGIDGVMADPVYTRPLLDKLGVEFGARVAIIGLEEPWFEELLADRTDADRARSVTPSGSRTSSSWAPVLDRRRPRAAPRALRESAIAPNGAIWVVSTKGRRARLRDIEVMEAARNAGLVDNKVVSFSDTQTSIRLVIRVVDRAAAAAESAPCAPWLNRPLDQASAVTVPSTHGSRRPDCPDRGLILADVASLQGAAEARPDDGPSSSRAPVQETAEVTVDAQDVWRVARLIGRS